MDELNNKLLIRYLTDDCTEKERRRIEEWMEKNTQNRELLKQYEDLWKKAAIDSNRSQKKFNTKKEWELLKKELEKEPTGPAKLKDNSYSTLKKRDLKYRLASAAAIFLAVVLIGFFAYRGWNSGSLAKQKPQMQEITTNIGQRTHITLSDGTRILLSADSQLRVPAVFKQNKREVFLNGQAYFNVTENASRPFIVHINGTTIRVLGTRFAVSSYPEDHNIQVVVKEGQVVFKANTQTSPASATLSAREVANYNKQTNTISTQKVDNLELYLGWTAGKINFDRTPMKEVAKVLKRRYGVEVKLKTPAIKKMTLTAHLKSKRIQNVLDVIAVSLQIEYKLKNGNVVFYR